jgi:hypothetical protein
MTACLVRAVTLGLLISGAGLAQSNMGDKAWNDLAKIAAGVKIKISFKDSAKDLKGQFASWDQAGLSVTRRDGSSLTVARGSIRKLSASSDLRQAAPWIGVGAGAATMGAISSRPRFDYVLTAVLMFAGVGAAIGYGIGMGFRYTVIYSAP